MIVKGQTKLVDLENGSEWRVDRKTRGVDLPGATAGQVVQTWVLILSNSKGERRFVPEKRVWEWYKLPEA